jgi:4-hydroxythreonine-4-phosphate dehydrogenase
VTVLAGSPYLRVSVIHGAGFDRAGENRAEPTNLLAALEMARELAPRWRVAARTEP